MNAGKPTTKLAAHRDGIVKPCGPEMQLQEPMLNQTGQQELQELKVKWKDAKMELDDERSGTRKLEKHLARVDILMTTKNEAIREEAPDVEQMRKRLETAEAEKFDLASVKARIARVEAEAKGENAKLKAERSSATATLDALHNRMADVESDQKRFAADSMLLQRRLEDNERREETPEPEPLMNTINAMLYDEQLSGHEQHIRTHAEQLMEYRKTLDDLQEQIRCAEANRDQERRQYARLLQEQLELMQASQRHSGPGAAPIHQYKDFNTVRGFRFKTRGELHKVEIAHNKGKFQLALDGEVVGMLKHRVFGAIFKKDKKRMECKVVVTTGERLDCVARMEWKPRQKSWDYELMVHGISVASCWERLSASGSGYYLMDTDWEPPEVVGPPSERLFDVRSSPPICTMTSDH